ncbi:DUF922 domain-containing protein [Seonamhaeicola aphaedonensis]|uniref:Secreted Zn-dependent protease n=1 Tax=Seonamhaeicola aphaedonensis TaxID=1461338 RepID=A0A3D9HFY5_9FLAO|nr:DUF922 domain-containing protein [Seonamhaeicola aphaedonensis]RED48399.1 hypothetical protein DFQ02_104245 [Seonamhaeicola aphaedonensis]
MLIRTCFVLCCFLLVHKEPVISWRDSYKLTWSDFKATPDNQSNAVAITASGITLGFSIKQTDGKVVSFKTEIDAHFYPEQSWYKPEKANNHVLQHEQLHFDITELYARKFRYRVSKLKESANIKRILQKLHDDINKELTSVQNSYDTETNYSRHVNAQAKWQAYIKEEIKKYSKYKSN